MFTPEYIARARGQITPLVEGYKLSAALDEIERLQAVERKAIEQSEYIQLNGMTEFEVAGLKAEIERLRAALLFFASEENWFDGEWASEIIESGMEYARSVLQGGE